MKKISIIFYIIFFLLPLQSAYVRAMEGDPQKGQEKSKLIQNLGSKNRKRKREEVVPLFYCVEDARLFAIVCKAGAVGETFHCIINGCKYSQSFVAYQEYVRHILEHIPFFKCLTCKKELYGLSGVQTHVHQCERPAIVRNDNDAKVLKEAKKKIPKKEREYFEEQIDCKGLSIVQNALVDTAIKKWVTTCNICSTLFRGKRAKETFKRHIIRSHLNVYSCAVCRKPLHEHAKKAASKGACELDNALKISNEHIVETISFSAQKIETLIKEWDIEDEFNEWKVRHTNRQQIEKFIKKVELYEPNSESNVQGSEDLLAENLGFPITRHQAADFNVGSQGDQCNRLDLLPRSDTENKGDYPDPKTIVDRWFS